MRHDPHQDDSYIRETHLEGVPARIFLSTRLIAALIIVLGFAVMLGVKIFFGDAGINYGMYVVGGIVVAGVILFRVVAGHWPLQGSRKLELD